MTVPGSPAERIVLTTAAALLLAVVGFVAFEWLAGDDSPPDPRAEVVVTAQRGQLWHVEVEVLNQGGETAESTEVTATLTLPGEEPIEGTQTIDFLASAASHTLRFVFPEDPAAGELEVRVTSFSVP